MQIHFPVMLSAAEAWTRKGIDGYNVLITAVVDYPLKRAVEAHENVHPKGYYKFILTMYLYGSKHIKLPSKP